MSAAADLRDWLKAVAGAAVFERGLDYWKQGRVGEVSRLGGQYEAIVTGTEPYHVEVRVSGGGVDGECDCPHAADGFFCKHMVATALAGAADANGETAIAAALARPGSVKRADRRAELAGFLRERDQAWLVDRLLEACEHDGDFAAGLLLAARLQGGDDVKTIERALSEAIGTTSGDPDWQAARRYAKRIDPVIVALEGLLGAGRVEAARIGANYLYKRVAAAAYRFDDSDGAIGNRGGRIGRLLGRALRAAPVGKGVALKLIDRLLADEWGWLPPQAYADWFDPIGLAAFEAEIERRLQALPASRRRIGASNDGFALQQWAERIRARRGETDALVALILARPELSARDYRDAARALSAADREREAVVVLERGAREAGDDVIRLELAAAYLRDGLDEDAERQIFLAFVARPDAALLPELRRVAGPRWPQRRVEVYAAIEQREQRRLADSRRWNPNAALDSQLQIECLLAEGEIDAAAALVEAPGRRVAGSSELVLLFLPHRPELALRIARALVDAMFEQRGRDQALYRTVSELVAHFVATAGDTPGLDQWVASLREANRRRPAFLDRFNRALAGAQPADQRAAT